MNWQRLIFLVMTSFVFMLRACDDGHSKEISYKKQCIFFPVVSSDLFPESQFGKRVAQAQVLFAKLKNNVPSFEYIEQLPDIAKEEVQKHVDAFEKYYDLGLNKNYVKKLKVVLKNGFFWLYIALASIYPIYALYYGKSLYKYAAAVFIFNSIFLRHFFYGLYPCQLFVFWEDRIAEPFNGRVAGRNMSFKNLLCWFFTHPLHNAEKRQLLINEYENHLRATIFAFKQIDQLMPTYTICSFLIFPKPVEILNFNTAKPLLVVSFDQNQKRRIMKKDLIKKWFPSHTFLWTTFNCKPENFFFQYDNDGLSDSYGVQLSFCSDFENLLRKELDQIKDSFGTIIYLGGTRENNSIDDDSLQTSFDKVVYDFAYSKRVHFIHFLPDCLTLLDQKKAYNSLIRNHLIFDRPIVNTISTNT